MLKGIRQPRRGANLVALDGVFRAAFDALSTQTAILEETGLIIAVNARWNEIADRTGTSPKSAAVGSNFFAVCDRCTGVDASVAQRAAEAVRLSFRGEAPRGLIVYACSGSSPARWYQMGMTRFEHSGIPRLVLSYEEITEVMQAREKLREKQQWLDFALQSSHTGIWDWNVISNSVLWSQTPHAAPGKTRNREKSDSSLQQIYRWIHSSDRQAVERCVKDLARGSSKNEASVEFRLKGRAGASHWILGKCHAVRDESGQVVRVVCVNTDITELKLAQLELRRLTARLIEAQEEDRRHIARELHDDISQRLALLMAELDAPSHSQLPETAASAAIQHLLKGMDEVTTDVRELSHRFHSSKLEHLGLKLALRGLCQQISSRDGIEISLVAEEIDPLARDVGLCLYRVAQEALLNVRKHSRARTATLSVTKTATMVRMSVTDSGIGFECMPRSGGLGLVSMRERLRMVGGELLVKAKPGHGTELTATVYSERVPLLESAS